MDNLRIVLIIIASLVIIALLIHGFWINKKERSTIFEPSKKKRITQDYDNKKEFDFSDNMNEINGISQQNYDRESKVTADVKIIASFESDEVKPVQQDLFVDEELVNQNIVDSQMAIVSSNEIKQVTINEYEPVIKPVQIVSEEPNKSVKNDVLVLHVVGLNDEQIRGDLLLSSVIQSGFQFGDMHIFHRHVDPAGNGPVLFSLANMVKPGTLDPETMHEFMTQGVSIFMMIPSYGNTAQNFKLMLQSAQRIADDVNGVVLDDEHHMLTPQKIDTYKTRIKDVGQ